MSALVVSAHAPRLGSGRALRSYGIVAALARLGPVDVVFAPFGGDGPDAAHAALDGVAYHAAPAGSPARRAAGYAAQRLAGTPDGFARGASPGLAAGAARLAARADRVVADGPTAAAALLALARRRRDGTVYNAHNLESAFRHEAGGDGLGSRRGLARFERRLLETFAESWMASRADLDGARTLAPDAILRYAPNVVDAEAIEPVPRVAEPRAVFLADFGYEPNVNARRFLLDDVLPAVWARDPGVRVALAGRGLDGFVAPDARVEVLGFVEDVREAYAGARAAVVPLLEGGGSPLKFVEALAHGIPVAATPRACAGLEVVAGEHCFAGEGAEGFAAAVLDALRSPRAGAVAAAGRALAEREYSIAALARRLTA